MSLAIKAPTGTADVYFLPDGTSYDQFLAGDIEPLTPYLNDPTKTAADYNLKDFPAGFLGSMYPPGDPNAQLYGIPISFETYILFYNKDLVTKYLGGTLPTTMDELTAAAAKITKDGAKDGVTGSVMRGIRSADSIMDTFSGVVYDSWGSKPAPAPYGLWFDGDWTKPRLTDPLICAGITNYAKLVAADRRTSSRSIGRTPSRSSRRARPRSTSTQACSAHHLRTRQNRKSPARLATFRCLRLLPVGRRTQATGPGVWRSRRTQRTRMPLGTSSSG